MYCINEKQQCSKIGYSGGAPCCGVLLQGGDTYFIKDGKIKGNCPLGILGQRRAMKPNPMNEDKEKKDSSLSYKEEIMLVLNITDEDLVYNKAEVIERLFCGALCKQSTDVISEVLTEYNKMKHEFYPFVQK